MEKGVIAAAVLLVAGAPLPSASPADYAVVDTGQSACYGSLSRITCPAAGQAFYGQDSQYDGIQPSYTLSGDGLTVCDNNTGLTWTRSPDLNGDGDIDSGDKLTFNGAQLYPATLNAQNFGGYNDWRVPTIKELYSLMDFRGTDPIAEGDDTTGLTPFIDTDYFEFGYGDTAAGERIIDSQWVTSTLYLDTVMGGDQAMFGVNFADGRIKGYPTDKTFYVRLCRGNTTYGVNDFVDNGDGTITDLATGLMWSQDDSGDGFNTGPRSGMIWEDALAWVRQKNAENYLGYSDWRLPNAKEMQSIVDYARAPGATGSAAIDPIFNITQITNEAGRVDYPWFWTGTTHVRWDGSGSGGVYICFGRGMGYMNGEWRDVHGAGCQRSDRKDGDFTGYTYVYNGYYFAMAPQGDASRMYNYVRLVRGGSTPAAGAHTLSLWNAPDAGDWTYWDAASRNPSPLARDLWVIPSGDETPLVADGEGAIASLKDEGGDYNIYLYEIPMAGDWIYWDAASRNPSPLARDLWLVPQGNDAVALCGLDTTGDGDSDSLCVVRSQGGDHNLYLWSMPEAGDWTYWDAFARNPSPRARDFWVLPAGNGTFLVADGGGRLASLKDEGGDHNIYLYEIPGSGDWTYWDAASRNPSPLARDLWVIPAGNSAVAMCGVDTTSDGVKDGLLVMRDEGGDYNLYLWNLPAPGDWTYWDAFARNPSPRARDFWLIPGGDGAVGLVPTDEGVGVFD